jgi:four helix bundle protein
MENGKWKIIFMKKDNLILNKTYSFALRIIKMYKYLIEVKKEFVLSKQVLRSGTSI